MVRWGEDPISKHRRVGKEGRGKRRKFPKGPVYVKMEPSGSRFPALKYGVSADADADVAQGRTSQLCPHFPRRPGLDTED